MLYKPPGHFRTVDDFRARLAEIAPEVAVDGKVRADGPLAEPIEVAGRRLEGRFAIHPMEGWDGSPEGLPGEATLRRWRRFGESGAGLIWGGEAFAVREDGRANPGQLYLNPAADTAGGLRALLAELRAGQGEAGLAPENTLVGLQLTHSGRFSRPHGPPAPRPADRHPVLDARLGEARSAPLVTDGELEAIGEGFVAGARLAREVGFDFVDVKSCHGYLLHELLGARHRGGTYGGSFENRTRLFRRIVEGIQRDAPGLTIGVRASLGDVFPHTPGEERVGTPAGWQEHLPYDEGFGVDRDDPRRMDPDEPLRFVGLARELGLRLVNVSLGSPYYCPHLQRPAAYPPSDGYQPPEDPLLGVARHLEAAARCKAAWPDLTVVGSGYSYLQEWLPHVAQAQVAAGHVDLVGLGRMVLSYPELPRDVLAGRPLDRRKLCRTFSDCTTAPRNGMISGCYPLDPWYRARPEAAALQALKKELR